MSQPINNVLVPVYDPGAYFGWFLRLVMLAGTGLMLTVAATWLAHACFGIDLFGATFDAREGNAWLGITGVLVIAALWLLPTTLRHRVLYDPATRALVLRGRVYCFWSERRLPLAGCERFTLYLNRTGGGMTGGTSRWKADADFSDGRREEFTVLRPDDQETLADSLRAATGLAVVQEKEVVHGSRQKAPPPTRRQLAVGLGVCTLFFGGLVTATWVHAFHQGRSGDVFGAVMATLICGSILTAVWRNALARKDEG